MLYYTSYTAYTSLILVNEMLTKTPDDTILKELRTRIQDRLRKALAKEKEREVQDPLKAAIDLMALSPEEMERWMSVFKRFDKGKRGGVSLDDIFTILDEHPNEYFMSVFTECEAINPATGLIDCGGFIRAFSTYCFFGKDEVLR